MTASGEGMTERAFHPVQFILLCLLVGPAVGFVAAECMDWLLHTTQIRVPFTHLRQREYWLLAYWLGGILAFIAAVIFVFIRYKFGFSGLSAAIFASSVIPAISTVSELLQDAFTGSLELHFFGNLLYLAFCAVPMSVCWLLARAFRIIQ